jgi:NAD(P)-dependent dehydrogenase (short-subunit alcohol dehydrogenase family)
MDVASGPSGASGASGRTFLVTGGNTGIGRATAVALARAGGRVFIACRSPSAGEAAVGFIKAESGSGFVWLLPLDLASLESVRSCAAEFGSRDEPLHVLVNNAGVGGQRGVTSDGFEQHFGVNHLGHFALTMGLLERLKTSGPGTRIVNVSSDVHYSPKGIDFDLLRQPTRSFAGMREYAVSKLCNVLFAQELARRLSGTGVASYALHPGGCLGYLAARAVAGARADKTSDAHRRAGVGHVGVLRHVRRCGSRNRAVLREVRGPDPEPCCHAGAWRTAVEVQHRVDGARLIRAYG